MRRPFPNPIHRPDAHVRGSNKAPLHRSAYLRLTTLLPLDLSLHIDFRKTSVSSTLQLEKS
jgi:hypothetical protein